MVKGMDVYIYTYTNYKHRNLTLNICSPSYDPLACFLAKTSPNWHFKTTVFYGVGFLTPCPTTNMEGQGFKSGFTPLVGLYKLDFVLFMYYNRKSLLYVSYCRDSFSTMPIVIYWQVIYPLWWISRILNYYYYYYYYYYYWCPRV